MFKCTRWITFYLLFSDRFSLTQVTFDKHKNVISRSEESFARYNIINQFMKHNDNIFVNPFHRYNHVGDINKLNLDFSVVTNVQAMVNRQFLSASDAHAYTYDNYQLCIYNKELVLLKQVERHVHTVYSYYTNCSTDPFFIYLPFA